MPEGKRKFIEDAARMIDGRVKALREEYALDATRIPAPSTLASDLAAIMEAEHCARLIRQLGRSPYRGEPYTVARDRWSKHGDPA